MPIEPQKPYVHQEYPKVVGYADDGKGKAFIARDLDHHQQLIDDGVVEPPEAKPTEAAPVLTRSHKKKGATPDPSQQ